MTRTALAAAGLVLLPPAVHAAAEASEPQVVAQLVGSTLFVVAFIFVLAWVAKRMRWQPRSTHGSLEVVAEFAIGARERVVLLRVGDRQALIGVGAGAISSLQLLETPVSLETGAPPTAQSLVERWLGARVGGRKP